MLTKEENELVTRTGPGTPMGEVMRRYWMPALLSSEVAGARRRAGAGEIARRETSCF